jgi:hypothetical protein
MSPDDVFWRQTVWIAVRKPSLPLSTGLIEPLDELLWVVLSGGVLNEGVDDLGIQGSSIAASRCLEHIYRLRGEVSDVDVRHAIDDTALIPRAIAARKVSDLDPFELFARTAER